MKRVSLMLIACWVIHSGQMAIAQITGELPKLAPPLPELPPTFWEQHGSVIVGMIILLAISAAGLWLNLREKTVEIVPPDVQARKELEAMKMLPDNDVTLSRISQALRRYLIAAFALMPGEYTTAELGQALSANETIGSELCSDVMDFLRRCDEQKFSASSESASINATEHALKLIGIAESRRAQLNESATTETVTNVPNR